ncbi:MAG: hypothetical protein OXD30_13505 [Bryobacterales bacterium]|nr:hypothetical protein [Bryobacterales bacterium]
MPSRTVTGGWGRNSARQSPLTKGRAEEGVAAGLEAPQGDGLAAGAQRHGLLGGHVLAGEPAAVDFDQPVAVAVLGPNGQPAEGEG